MNLLTLKLTWTLLIACISVAAFAQAPAGGEAVVSAILDDFHDAASKADYDRYTGHFAANAVFMGTDATERWTLDEFKAYAKKRFDLGRGWTYFMTSRYIYFSGDGKTAWFDEMLTNNNYGTCRGTGVFISVDGTWKLIRYNLSIPIPNALAKEVVGMIRAEDSN